MKPMLLIVTAIFAFGSIVARADAIDTEHLFGFTIGTDVGEVGEKEFESVAIFARNARTRCSPTLPPSASISRSPWTSFRPARSTC
jgi:hypothetical protein